MARINSPGALDVLFRFCASAAGVRHDIVGLWLPEPRIYMDVAPVFAS